jgi:hypothetical protein
MDEPTTPRPSEQENPNPKANRRTFLSGLGWALPAIYLFEWGVHEAFAGPHQDTHTDGHFDIPGPLHKDNGHTDSGIGPPQHNDAAHQDTAHYDGTFAGGHYDVGHTDNGHIDTNQWSGKHLDTAHNDVAAGHQDGPRSSHGDVPFSDGPSA